MQFCRMEKLWGMMNDSTLTVSDTTTVQTAHNTDSEQTDEEIKKIVPVVGKRQKTL